MHRHHLFTLLERYRRRYAHDSAEMSIADRIERFAQEHSECLWRTCVDGHITGSAWIVSHDHSRFLLTHHRKLDRWLQLGGHVDGESCIEQGALREAREESGIPHFELFQPTGVVVPLDLDIHPIPARGSEAAHHHFDLRFLLIAPEDSPLVLSEESHDLRWFNRMDLRSFVSETSMLRMADKAFNLLDQYSHR